MLLAENKFRYPTKFMKDLATQIKNSTLNKMYNYDIFDGKYTGICIIQEVSYDALFKEFDIVIEDTNTGRRFIIDRCHICLKEIKL